MGPSLRTLTVIRFNGSLIRYSRRSSISGNIRRASYHKGTMVTIRRTLFVGMNYGSLNDIRIRIHLRNVNFFGASTRSITYLRSRLGRSRVLGNKPLRYRSLLSRIYTISRHDFLRVFTNIEGEYNMRSKNPTNALPSTTSSMSKTRHFQRHRRISTNIGRTIRQTNSARRRPSSTTRRSSQSRIKRVRRRLRLLLSLLTLSAIRRRYRRSKSQRTPRRAMSTRLRNISRVALRIQQKRRTNGIFRTCPLTTPSTPRKVMLLRYSRCATRKDMLRRRHRHRNERRRRRMGLPVPFSMSPYIIRLTFYYRRDHFQQNHLYFRRSFSSF